MNDLLVMIDCFGVLAVLGAKSNTIVFDFFRICWHCTCYAWYRSGVSGDRRVRPIPVCLPSASGYIIKRHSVTRHVSDRFRSCNPCHYLSPQGSTVLDATCD